MVNDAFFNERMVLCYQRVLSQRPAGNKHYQSYESKSHAKIIQPKLNMLFERTAKNHLVKIQPVPEQNERCHERYRSIISF